MLDELEKHERKQLVWTFAKIVSVFLIMGLFMLASVRISAPITHIGTVQSSGAVDVSLGKGMAGVQGQATVRLENGEIVLAGVIAVGPLVAGDRVTVTEERRIFGIPAFRLVAKQPR
jgi:hypothetical protein